jgi:hypothetical protein
VRQLDVVELLLESCGAPEAAATRRGVTLQKQARNVRHERIDAEIRGAVSYSSIGFVQLRYGRRWLARHTCSPGSFLLVFLRINVPGALCDSWPIAAVFVGDLLLGAVKQGY